MNNTIVNPKVVRAGEGQTFHLPGGAFRPILNAADTDGALSFCHARFTAGSGTPPHVHTREDEFFYIESGEFIIGIGDQQHTARAGDFVFAPRLVPHSFACQSEVGTFYSGSINAGFENMLLDMAESHANGELSPTKFLALGESYGIHFDDFESVAAPAMVAHIRRDGESEAMQAYGDSLITLVGTSQTQQQFCIVVDDTPAQSGPPVHIHENEAEMFLILSGRYEHQTGI